MWNAASIMCKTLDMKGCLCGADCVSLFETKSLLVLMDLNLSILFYKLQDKHLVFFKLKLKSSLSK